MSGPRHIYFAERDGSIKIGCSGNPKQRMKDLKADLLAVVPDCGFKVERQLHQWFAAFALGGEWFKDNPELRSLVNAHAQYPAWEGERTRPMSAKQVAEAFRVSPSTVANWADTGRLRCFKTPGGHRRFQCQDVQAFFTSCESTA